MSKRPLFLLIAAISLIAPAWADKADTGNKHREKPHQQKSSGKPGKIERQHGVEGSQAENPAYRTTQAGFFTQAHRGIVRDYYADAFQRNNCPPGLAKKHNGCLPPGQAKRWSVGHPLPHDVVYYELPDHLLRQIGYPPHGYRFVRVDSDILLLAIGTGLVVDALTNLSAGP